jgi:hypothetical protein
MVTERHCSRDRDSSTHYPALGRWQAPGHGPEAI